MLRFIKKKRHQRKKKEEWMEKMDACAGEPSEELMALPDPHASKAWRLRQGPVMNARRHSASTRESVLATQLLDTRELVDLAEEELEIDEDKAMTLRRSMIASTPVGKSGEFTIPEGSSSSAPRLSALEAEPFDPVAIVRYNLPPDPLLSTPFGMRRMTYADYTASGRNLHCNDEYMARVVSPMYSNTHTETSAAGLQTTHMREEARAIILKGLHAPTQEYSLIFTGTGVTGAIWKLIALLGIHCPPQLKPYLKESEIKRPLILCSHSEHHSNELMWRETISDVMPIPPDDTGSLDLTFLRRILEQHKEKYDLIIGSFSAGSNVTGLITPPHPVAKLMHEYGGYCCFDFAGAGPYVDINVNGNGTDDYLDAIFISPHKFVGGPGTPGLLCIRREFANVRGGMDLPPTIAGGGTVKMVWPTDVDDVSDSNRVYEDMLHVREEAGTPGIVESIRCGLAFQIRDMVGPKRIEELEGEYASEAVRRLQAKKVWIMGDIFKNITSKQRLSITSFNIWCKLPNYDNGLTDTDTPPGTFLHPTFKRPLILHPHFVAALLNDVYGIQARSGCACAGPLSFRLFGPRFPFMEKDTIEEITSLAEDGYHALKPGFCRVNFNYFISREEFDFIVSAIEQIAEHGWKLLPLYALCLRTGQYWFNGIEKNSKSGVYSSFNRFDAVRQLTELQFEKNNTITWHECVFSEADRAQYLKDALVLYEEAPKMIRKALFRFRDLRRKDVKFPNKHERYRFFVLASEVLPSLGITEEEVQAATATALAQDKAVNPMIVAFPKHNSANPVFTMDRPRG